MKPCYTLAHEIVDQHQLEAAIKDRILKRAIRDKLKKLVDED